MSHPSKTPPTPQPPSSSPQIAGEAGTRDNTSRLFSPALYAGILGAGLIIGGRAACYYEATHTNPNATDDRTTSSEALHARHIVTKRDTGEITPEKVDRVQKDAQCFLEMNCFRPSDAPRPGISRELWEANQKTHNDFVLFQYNGTGPTKRYSKHDNLFGYYLDKRWSDQANYLWQKARNEHWAKSYGSMYQDFQQKTQTPEGLKGEAKVKWEVGAWEKYAGENFFGQPVECPKWEDGSCMKTWIGLTWEDIQALGEAKKKGDEAAVKAIRSKGRDCLLLKPLARKVTMANRAMYEYTDHKEQIYPMTCFRDNFHQALLAVSIPKNGGCHPVTDSDALVQDPGESSHESAGAMDVENYEEAAPFLSAIAGMDCAFVGRKLSFLRLFKVFRFIAWGDDLAHCSPAERPVTEDTIKEKEWVEGKLNAEKFQKVVADVLGNMMHGQ